MPPSLPRLGGWRSVGALVAAAAVVTGIGQTGAGHSLLEKAGLIQRPNPYTALSFASPEQPPQPKALRGQRVQYTLAFVIQNAEPRPQDYRWYVRLAQPGSPPRVIGTSTHRVVPGNKATIPFRKTISCRPGSVEFIVQLADPREAIHTWGTCPRHPG